MKNLNAIVIIGLASVAGTPAQVASDGPPPWAYGVPSAAGALPLDLAVNRRSGVTGDATAGQAAAEDALPRRVPGSPATFTLTQIRDRFGPVDWFPEDHPTMPAVVAHGRMPNIWACALCHYPTGRGQPENAGLAGLPYSYFVQQITEFKNDARKSAEPRKTNTSIMASIAKAMTDDEVKAAAEYFSSIEWKPWIKVVETGTVPKTRIALGMFIPLKGTGTEPLGRRIIEVPEDVERTETLLDPRSGFIAYAPIGSVKRGGSLVRTGAGKTTECRVCHGADLKGLGPVPGIAGRSPSYAVRQMYDMQVGARKGVWTNLMKPVVAALTNEDMLAIAVYAASLKP
jgi:cytochrome c553